VDGVYLFAPIQLRALECLLALRIRDRGSPGQEFRKPPAPPLPDRPTEARIRNKRAREHNRRSHLCGIRTSRGRNPFADGSVATLVVVLKVPDQMADAHILVPTVAAPPDGSKHHHLQRQSHSRGTVAGPQPLRRPRVPLSLPRQGNVQGMGTLATPERASGSFCDRPAAKDCERPIAFH